MNYCTHVGHRRMKQLAKRTQHRALAPPYPPLPQPTEPTSRSILPCKQTKKGGWPTLGPAPTNDRDRLLETL